MDIKSRNALVTQHIGLVRKVAYSYSIKSTVALEDLEQVGTIGLINAINKFDPDRGYKFSTYAVPLIRGEILHYLRDKAPPIKAPRSYSEIFQSVNRLSIKKGISLLEAAALKNVSAQKWQIIAGAMSASSRVLEIDEKLTNSLALVGEEENCDRALLLASLDKLPELEKKALTAVYFDSMNGNALANYLECDRIAASTLVSNALLKLKSQVESHKSEVKTDSIFTSARCRPPTSNFKKVYQLSVASFKDYQSLQSCPKCGHSKTYIHGKSPQGKVRYFCPGCDRTFISTVGTISYRRRITTEQIEAILHKRALGESLRSISKSIGLATGTIVGIVRAAKPSRKSQVTSRK